MLEPLSAVPARISFSFIQTPFGKALIGLTNGALCFLGFGEETEEMDLLAEVSKNWPGAELTKDMELSCCPWGKDVVQLAVRGTPLQLTVWQALLAIPEGDTLSYEALAQRVGRPDAVRAVASAVGANPISWLIPCHRVLRKDGSPGGYRWGLEVKNRLLEGEQSR